MNGTSNERQAPSFEETTAWDRLTGRLLKKWAGASSPSGRIREGLLSRARGISPGWNWIERSYWVQHGSSPVFQHYPGVLNPVEARGHSLLSLTMCAMLQPGMVTHS